MENILSKWLETYFDEVTPIDFYRDIFPAGELEKQGEYEKGKYCGIAVEITKEKKPNGKPRIKRYSITDELSTIEKLTESDNFCLMSPISYAGKERTAERARFIYAVAIDLAMTRGSWTGIELDTPFSYNGMSNLAIIVDDNSGNWTNSPHMACRVYDANGSQAIRVYNDYTDYNPDSPSGYQGATLSVKNQVIMKMKNSFAIHTIVANNISLNSGWSWFSSYIEFDENTFSDLKAAIAASNTTATIKDMRNSASLANNAWVGNLPFANAQMYMVNLSDGLNYTMEGDLVNPADHPVTIVNGWNWIPFLSNEPMALSEALAGITPTVNDLIKDMSNSATFKSDSGWTGNLNTLTPGKGYMYYHQGADIILVYPVASGKGTVVRPAVECP